MFIELKLVHRIFAYISRPSQLCGQFRAVVPNVEPVRGQFENELLTVNFWFEFYY